MRSVLISIRPQWVDKIVSGEKTVEVRKSKPKLEPPFKCYVYCTHGSLYLNRHNGNLYTEKKDILGNRGYGLYTRLNGLVIGEFVCERIEDYSKWEYDHASLLRHIDLYAATKGDYKFLSEYIPQKKGFGWHISDLKIYDTPKEICDFRRQCKEDICCERCAMYSENRGQCENIGLTWIRPPQSWGYAEERKKP